MRQMRATAACTSLAPARAGACSALTTTVARAAQAHEALPAAVIGALMREMKELSERPPDGIRVRAWRRRQRAGALSAGLQVPPLLHRSCAAASRCAAARRLRPPLPSARALALPRSRRRRRRRPLPLLGPTQRRRRGADGPGARAQVIFNEDNLSDIAAELDGPGACGAPPLGAPAAS